MKLLLGSFVKEGINAWYNNANSSERTLTKVGKPAYNQLTAHSSQLTANCCLFRI